MRILHIGLITSVNLLFFVIVSTLLCSSNFACAAQAKSKGLTAGTARKMLLARGAQVRTLAITYTEQDKTGRNKQDMEGANMPTIHVSLKWDRIHNFVYQTSVVT